MTKEELLIRLKEWEYDWTYYFPLDSDNSFTKGGLAIKTFTLRRLRMLIQENE